MVSVSGWSVVQVFTQVSRSQVSPRPTLVVCDFFACSYGKWSIQTPISMFDDCFYSHPIKKSRIDTPSLSLLNHRNDHFKPPKEWLMIDFPIDIPLLISHSYPPPGIHRRLRTARTWPAPRPLETGCGLWRSRRQGMDDGFLSKFDGHEIKKQ